MRNLIPLLLLFVSLPTLAKREFDIEVIIFKRAVNAEQVNESWPNQLPIINMENVGSFQDSEYRSRKGVQMLASSEYQLTSQRDALKKHAGFKVLLHTAWRQGDQGRASAPVFHIQAGKDYSEKFNPDGSEKVSFIDHSFVGQSVDSSIGITEETIDQPLYELEGKLQIYVQHYLYADTTLDLKAPSIREVTIEAKELDLSSDDPQEIESNIQLGNLEDISPTIEIEEFLKSYRMKQKRRMRSSETHYLDNPLLGVIVQVRKVLPTQ